VIAGVFLSYALVTVASSLINDNPGRGLAAAASHLGFIAVLPLLPVLRYDCDEYWARWFTASLAVGGCLAGIVALAAATINRSLRVEALTGNPLIFAYLVGVMACLNGWLALESRGRIQLFHSIATLASLLALVLAGSRGPLAAFAAVAAGALLWKIVTAARDLFRLAISFYVLIAAIAFVYVSLNSFTATQRVVDLLAGRFATLGQFLVESPNGPTIDANLDARRTMLDAGWQAFVERPFLGHGRQNVMDAVSKIAGADPLPFTHLHNAFLTEAVASGILGLIAFCAVLALPIVAARGARPWQALAVILTAFTALYGMANIGFNHDIKVFSYALFIVILNALAQQRRLLNPEQSIRYCKYVKHKVENS
jgi:O-antigen ligase